MGRRTTRSEAELDAMLQRVPPGSERHRVLVAARAFRASWVELGELLTQVREDQTYQQWGYTSFEAYCRRELRLRSDTVAKLTRSFSFLRDHEPTLMEAKPTESELPPLDVVDLLSRARERAKVSDEQLDSIRQEVFSPDGPATRSQVLKRFREVDPDAFRGAPKPEKVANSDAPAVPIDLRKALLLAERLHALIEQDGAASDAARRGIEVVVNDLRGRMQAAA